MTFVAVACCINKWYGNTWFDFHHSMPGSFSHLVLPGFTSLKMNIVLFIKSYIVLYLYGCYSLPGHLMKGVNYFLCLLLLMTSSYSFAQEICDNAKDDDSDGLVDLYDPDCQCHYRSLAEHATRCGKKYSH